MNAKSALPFAKSALLTFIMLGSCFIVPGYADIIGLEWKAPITNVDGSVLSDGDHYVIYKNGTAMSPVIPWTQDKNGNGDPDATLSGIISGDIFQVTAVDHDGNESARSNSVTYKDLLVPAAPGSLIIIIFESD